MALPVYTVKECSKGSESKTIEMKKIIIFLSVVLLAASCCRFDVREQLAEDIIIYPDYKDVTVPFNIAPLNFMTLGVQKGAVRFSADDGLSTDVAVKNGKVDIPIRKWRNMLDSSKGGSLSVTVADADGNAYRPFHIHVSADPVDRYVAYRLIEPGYVLWNEMGIYQRDLESFRQTAIVENKEIDHACVNCHSFADRDPETMVMHARKTAYGGTYIQKDGRWEMLDTKTPQTISALVYPFWHPGRRFVAFSVNDTKQTFHVSDLNKIFVYDFKSDVVVYDTDERKLLTAPALFSRTSFETFPAFSNDGKRLYYCTADSVKMPTDYRQLKYSLCSIEFDENTGSFGKTDTLVRAGSESVTMPRVSPDGRYLLYTSTAYGNFTVWHKDADLALIDLVDGSIRKAGEWNSSDAESYHSWSGNSRWAVFSSRRDGTGFTRLYIGHIGEDGKLGKAFLLPQKDPESNKRLMKSYNIPEFVEGKVSPKGYAIRNVEDRYQVEFAGSYLPVDLDGATGASVSPVN